MHSSCSVDPQFQLPCADTVQDSLPPDKVARYIRAGREAGVEVLPPNINRSDRDFSVEYTSGQQAKILFGLGAIKGVGDAALTAMVSAREDGPFSDIFDFTSRVDLGKVNKAVIESLIRAGAFDLLDGSKDINRGQIHGILDQALERGRSAQRDRESGQISLFGALDASAQSGGDGISSMDPSYGDAPPWSDQTLLLNEKNAIGFYMSGHPMDRYVDEAVRLTNNETTITVAKRKGGTKITVAGMVMEYREKTTKTGKRLGLFSLEDLEGRIDVVVYSEALEKIADFLPCDEPVLVSGTVRVDQRSDDETRSIILNEAVLLQEARGKRTKEVHLHLDASKFPLETMPELKSLLEGHPGRCDAFLEIAIEGVSVTSMILPERFRVAPSDDLIVKMEQLDGISRIEFR